MAHATSIAGPNRRALHLPAIVGEIGRTGLAGLDGLLAGLTVGYVALATLGAPSHHLGVPWPVAMLVVGGLVVVIAGVGAVVATMAARAVGWIGRRLRSLLERTGSPRIAAAVTAPLRFIDGLPTVWIGAFGALLWVALTGRTMGPLGLFTPPGMLSTFVYAVGIIAALVAMARALRPSAGGRRRQSVAGSLMAAAALMAVMGVAYAMWPGGTEGVVAYDAAFDRVALALGVASVSDDGLDDPGAPGPFEVARASYGSGVDARRPAFGADADLVTPTVDASAVLRALGGGADEARAMFWGFGTDALPIDGLVWAPRGPGPFPLVLVVHGNHAMGDFSESGYAYLGDLLASRGFITVSVDEDFLNGSWAGDWEGDEQVARAWLLLLHLDQWRTWAADPASPFFGRVDLDRVALIGHSRGGEAASVAAMLAGAPIPPRAGMAPWPMGLDIDAVVSIAPSDGQYPGAVRLEGVDFLTVQGGWDSDARAWSGIRQYARTAPDVDGFKAALWSYRADHGQFNTVWGRDDRGPFSGVHLATAPLLTADEQEDLAKTTIGGFLEASLHDREGYRGLFRRPMVGRGWLPEDVILVRSAAGDDVGLTTVAPDRPADGLAIETDGLAASAAMTIPLRALGPDQASRAVAARWSSGPGDAVWGVTGIDGTQIPVTSGTEVRFAIADGRGVEGGVPPRLAIAIEVVDGDGTSVSISLDSVGALPPPLPVRFAKNDLLMATTTIDVGLRTPVERVLQTYAVPLAAFEAADPRFDASTLDAVRVRVDRTAPGVLWIADVSLGASPASVPLATRFRADGP